MTIAPQKPTNTVRIALPGHSLRTTVEVVVITPELATEWLETNFKQNRKLNIANVKKLAADIKQKRFRLSCDCIAFDENGQLINGQHRLNAVVLAQESAIFLVARDFPRDSLQVLDIGKKRMMHERITVAGVPMLEKECACIRNGMTTWTGKTTLGTMRFSQIRHDDMVVKVFKEHVLWLKLMTALGYLKTSWPTFFTVAAHMIYVEGKRREKLIGSTPTGISPLQRALQFLECSSSGTIELTGSYKSKRDMSAQKLRDTYLQAKAKARHWSTFEYFAITVNMAKKFHDGDVIATVRVPAANPFNKSLDAFGSSNAHLLEDFKQGDVSNFLDRKIIDQALAEYDQAVSSMD